MRRRLSREGAAVLGLVAIAAILRFVGLDSQLWLDEISALTGSIERPFSSIATRWPGSASHIFYELLARAGLLTIGVPAGIRVPAALCGVAGVALVWRFAHRAFGARPAYTITGLLAVSYHHVMFSQNARGYTLMIALYLVTLVVLVEAAERPRAGGAALVTYAVAGALAAYSMPMGMFILPGQMLVLLGAWWRGRSQGGAGPWARFVAGALAGGVLTALLYAPFVGAMLRFTRMNAATPEEGPRLGIGLLREVLDGLLGAFHGPIGVALVTAFGAVGLWAWWRRHPLSLLFAIAPIALEGVAVVVAGVGIHPRYFALVLPVLLIVAGLGLDSVVSAVTRRLTADPRRQQVITATALALAVLVAAVPLIRYYQYPKQDFLGAIAVVEARPSCTARVGIDVAGHVLQDYYRAGFATAENAAELRAIEERVRPGTVCAVTTLEGLLAISDPEVVSHLRAEYRRIAWLPGTVGDAAMRIYEREVR